MKKLKSFKKISKLFFPYQFPYVLLQSAPWEADFQQKTQFFKFFSLGRWNHVDTCSTVRYVSFRYHGIFWNKLSHIMRYFTTYENSRTKRAQKKACFLLILRISKSPSVAMCCLNVDLYLSFHKHTPKLPLALSRLSRSLLDRFLNDKTWFFVFSTLYARWVTKGLRTQIWSTCQNIKKFKVVSRFLLWKKILKNHCIAEKFLSKMNFKEKVRLQQCKKVSVAFCKKDWIWNNNNLCVAKKIARTKKTTKSKKCLESPFLLEEKIKKKMQCSRSWSVVENLFLSAVFLSAWKKAENIVRSVVFEAPSNRKNICFFPQWFFLPFFLL